MTADDKILAAALRNARDTRSLLIGAGVLNEVAEVFGTQFGSAPCIVVADTNTFTVAGRNVFDALRRSGQPCHEPLILAADGLYAEYSFVERVEQTIRGIDAIPIAVGAGTINDLTKLATHQCGRPYMAMATAASMDGYTAYGASITYQGSKQTFDCPAPRAVVADLDVIAAAPVGMNASGYADLLAKCPAGADWILADALEIEPIDRTAWDLVQPGLRFWMDDPAGVRAGDIEALRRLTTALMMTGFAMQAALSSRPASGAEHQFSHLWDMEHHTYHGSTPSHGFKVGIGSLASLAMYEALLDMDVEQLDVEAAVHAWPDANANEKEVRKLFSGEELAIKAAEESGFKHVAPDVLRSQLITLKKRWPKLRERLSKQLIGRAAARDMLRAAGCPFKSEQISISHDRLRLSYRKAYHIRRRFTILDVVRRANLWDAALDRIFHA
jgi:glycerol-1-phosphate dehydrogenase [NAD(P)+]